METNENVVIPEQETENSDTENKKVKTKKWLKKILGFKKSWWKLAVAILAAIVIVVVAVLWTQSKKQGGQVTTISKASLQKVVQISELSTIDYTYNAIATKYDKNHDAKYYVAYEGTVTAGIDFHEIDIDIIAEEKKVILTIPDVEIQGVKVNMGTMDYIFIKDKYETKEITQEAYKLCKKDLKKRIKQENVLYDTARENAKSAVEALFKPFVETVDRSYSIEIR